MLILYYRQTKLCDIHSLVTLWFIRSTKFSIKYAQFLNIDWEYTENHNAFITCYIPIFIHDIFYSFSILKKTTISVFSLAPFINRWNTRVAQYQNWRVHESAIHYKCQSKSFLYTKTILVLWSLIKVLHIVDR